MILFIFKATVKLLVPELKEIIHNLKIIKEASKTSLRELAG